MKSVQAVLNAYAERYSYIEDETKLSQHKKY